MIIRLKQPYQIIPHLSRFAIPEPTPCLFEGNVFWRIYEINGTFVPISVKIFDDKLKVSYFGDVEKSKIRKLMKYVFAVDFDWKKFERKVKKYEQIYLIISKYHGLRPMRTVSIYEALLKSILEQRINLKVALYTFSKLVKKFGIKKKIDRTYYSSPLKEKILKSKNLINFGMTKVKAKSILEVSKFDLPSLKEINRNKDYWVDELQKIYGIGRWTAELSIAMVSNDFSVGPIDDLNVMKALSKFGVNREFIKEIKEYKGLVMYLLAFDV